MASTKPDGIKTGGRKPGAKNKTTTAVKEMILAALEAAGNKVAGAVATKHGKGGGLAYLTKQAEENPVAFMALLAKIIPYQMTGEGGAPISITVTTGVPRGSN